MSPLVTMIRRLNLALITHEEHGGDDSDHETNTWLLKMLTGMNV